MIATLPLVQLFFFHVLLIKKVRPGIFLLIFNTFNSLVKELYVLVRTHEAFLLCMYGAWLLSHFSLFLFCLTCKEKEIIQCGLGGFCDVDIDNFNSTI